MKRKFRYMLLITSISNITSIFAMKKEIKGAINLGKNGVCFLEGPPNFWPIKVQKNGDDCIILSADKEMEVKISAEDKVLTVSGKKRKRNQDQSDDNITDTKKQKQDLSLDGEESYEVPLEIGKPIVLDNESQLKLTYDEKLKLISEKDHSQYSVLLSNWKKSHIVLGATNPQAMKYRQQKDRGKVYLEESEEEIKLIDSVYKYSGSDTALHKALKDLLEKLPPIEHSWLLAYLDKHDPGKKFDPYCSYFDNVRELLGKKMSNSLEEATKTGMLSKVTWLDLIDTVEVRNIIENILKERVIKPIPKILQSIDLTNYNEKDFNAATMRMVIETKSGDETLIIDLLTKKIIWRGKNVENISLTHSGTKAEIIYAVLSPLGIHVLRNYELIDLENGNNILFRQKNITAEPILSLLETRLIISRDNEECVIDLAHGNTVLYRDAASICFLDEAGSIIEVSCEINEDSGGRKIKVINLDLKNAILLEEDNVAETEIASSNTTNNIMISCADIDETIKIISFKKGETNGKVVLEKKGKEKDEWIALDKFGTNLATWDDKGDGKVIKLKNKEIVLQKVNVRYMYFNDELITIFFKDDSAETIDLKNGKTILKEVNTDGLTLYSSKLALVSYNDDKETKIIKNLKNKAILYKTDSSSVTCDAASMKAVSRHENGKVIVVDLLKNYNYDIAFTKLSLKNLISFFILSKNLDFTNETDLKNYHSLLQSLNPNTKMEIT